MDGFSEEVSVVVVVVNAMHTLEAATSNTTGNTTIRSLAIFMQSGLADGKIPELLLFSERPSQLLSLSIRDACPLNRGVRRGSQSDGDTDCFGKE
jgi:hypothetical protein